MSALTWKGVTGRSRKAPSDPGPVRRRATCAVPARTERTGTEGEAPMQASLAALIPPLLLIALLIVALTVGRSETPPPSLPEGNAGIAARYPGDADIEKDPAVVFHHDFEDCRTPADLSAKWDVMYGPEYMNITEEPANVSGGLRALEMTIPRQQRSLSVDVGRSLAEVRDVLFLRFYTKF